MQFPGRERSAEPNFSGSAFPSRFLDWFPFVWSRVLFAGSSVQAEAIRWRSLVLLTVLPSVLIYGCLSFHLLEPDEGRYAEIPREMLLRGEWVVPYLDGEPYLDKPPLLYWLVNLSYRMFGVHDWAARLVPAVAVHVCILLTYLFGRRILGERAGFYGALLLGLAPGLTSIGRLLIMDSLLALWTMLGLFAGFEAICGSRLRLQWGLLAAVACGLGILTKGPVALLLVVPPLIAYRWLSSKACSLPWRSLVLLAAVMLAVAVPWYVAICLRLPRFAYHFLWQHNVVRFVAPFDHLRPIWYYGPILMVGLLPGTLAAIPLIRFLFSSDPEVRGQRSPELGFVLLGGGWVLLFFSLSGCKLPTYILPAFPPLALAIGLFLAHSSWQRSVWPKMMAGAAFLFLFGLHNIALPWYARYRAPMARMAELHEFCSDPRTPVICYPRNCDSVSFYLGRDDLLNYRSKKTTEMVRFLQEHDRAVLILTHRHSLQGLRYALTPDLKVVEERHFGLSPLAGLPDGVAQKLTWLMGETSLGLCDLAVVERRPPPPAPSIGHLNPSLLSME